VKHFYQNIQGWFTFPQLYSYVVKEAPQVAHFVEVGTWKGTSTAYMGVEIINSEKNIKFDCVDPFIAVGDEQPQYKISHADLKNEFIQNMKPLEGHYTLYDIGSLDAVKTYKENSLDFVFIDGSHKYEDVVADIKAWLPKIKKGGFLAGHDYSFGWPDVVKAVNDALGKNNLQDPWGCHCWMVQI
jgi:predicted O-methyltransferase YrrM